MGGYSLNWVSDQRGTEVPLGGYAQVKKLVAIITLTFASLSLGASWSHILQVRGKADWDGPFWRMAMETLYRDYATIGAATEIGAIVLAWLLVFFFRKDSQARAWAAAGAILLSIAFFGLWLGFIAPINAVFATWSPDSIPTDWTVYRDKWEFWHAMIAVIKTLAFVALLVATVHLPNETANQNR
jgi:hypothetical protein